MEIDVLYGLRVRTPRLELRLGSRDELLELGRVVEQGVHPPEEMSFAVAWTDRIGEPDFLDGFVAFTATLRRQRNSPKSAERARGSLTSEAPSALS